MTTSDEEFLRNLKIAPWPEADTYKYIKHPEPQNPPDIIRSKQTSMNFNDDTTPNPFGYYDENPHESPFVDAEADDTYADDDLYQSRVTSELVVLMQEYLSFATVSDLYKLVKDISE